MEHFSESLLKRVRKTGIFETMTRQETIRVLSDPRAYLVGFHPEETVFEPENFMHCLGYVVSGRIGIRMSGYPMRTLTQGSCFGAAALFGNEGRYVTEIRAQSETRILFFENTLVEECVRTIPSFAEGYIRFLSERIRFLNRKIRLLSGHDSLNALTIYLSEQVPDCDGVIPVKSYTQLARTLNMSRSSLYRVMEELEKDGMIRKQGKGILLTDPEAFL
ncbi:MAG: Crp/Fnr family transcriptional regulator [Clostridia bacterium]|nr:Crp/Fnr family transcriptional regulator [Clostridia bacterium]